MLAKELATTDDLWTRVKEIAHRHNLVPRCQAMLALIFTLRADGDAEVAMHSSQFRKRANSLGYEVGILSEANELTDDSVKHCVRRLDKLGLVVWDSAASSSVRGIVLRFGPQLDTPDPQPLLPPIATELAADQVEPWRPRLWEPDAEQGDEPEPAEEAAPTSHVFFAGPTFASTTGARAPAPPTAPPPLLYSIPAPCLPPFTPAEDQSLSMETDRDRSLVLEQDKQTRAIADRLHKAAVRYQAELADPQCDHWVLLAAANMVAARILTDRDVVEAANYGRLRALRRHEAYHWALEQDRVAATTAAATAAKLGIEPEPFTPKAKPPAGPGATFIQRLREKAQASFARAGRADPGFFVRTKDVERLRKFCGRAFHPEWEWTYRLATHDDQRGERANE